MRLRSGLYPCISRPLASPAHGEMNLPPAMSPPTCQLANLLSSRKRGAIEDCISNVRTNAPEAQSWLAPRFSVGKRDSTSSLQSPVGTAQGHYLCRNQQLAVFAPTSRFLLHCSRSPRRAESCFPPGALLSIFRYGKWKTAMLPSVYAYVVASIPSVWTSWWKCTSTNKAMPAFCGIAFR